MVRICRRERERDPMKGKTEEGILEVLKPGDCFVGMVTGYTR